MPVKQPGHGEESWNNSVSANIYLCTAVWVGQKSICEQYPLRPAEHFVVHQENLSYRLSELNWQEAVTAGNWIQKEAKPRKSCLRTILVWYSLPTAFIDVLLISCVLSVPYCGLKIKLEATAFVAEKGSPGKKKCKKGVKKFDIVGWIGALGTPHTIKALCSAGRTLFVCSLSPAPLRRLPRSFRICPSPKLLFPTGNLRLLLLMWISYCF